MAEQSVRKQLVEALEYCKETLATIPPNHFTSRHKASVRRADLAIDRHRAEPEEPCHCKVNECGPECPCYEAGLEAQRDPEALLREAGQRRREEGEELSVSLNRVRDGG